MYLKYYITDYEILNGDTATQNHVGLIPSACDSRLKFLKITTEIKNGIMVDI